MRPLHCVLSDVIGSLPTHNLTMGDKAKYDEADELFKQEWRDIINVLNGKFSNSVDARNFMIQVLDEATNNRALDGRAISPRAYTYEGNGAVTFSKEVIKRATEDKCTTVTIYKQLEKYDEN